MRKSCPQRSYTGPRIVKIIHGKKAMVSLDRLMIKTLNKTCIDFLFIFLWLFSLFKITWTLQYMYINLHLHNTLEINTSVTLPIKQYVNIHSLHISKYKATISSVMNASPIMSTLTFSHHNKHACIIFL